MAGGEGCRDERRGSSASEVGTDDGTAKKKEKKEKEKKRITEPCFGIGHNLSLICQLTSEDIKHQFIIISLMKFIVQELCESRGGRPELSVLTILLVSVDVKVC